MAQFIFDTLTQKNTEFQPLEAGKVKMYVCGPTVYGLLHIGNFRGPIFFNLVRNWLEKQHGYHVEYVYNYTDVDDKIIERANREKVDSGQIAEQYIGEFQKDFAALKLRPHSSNPRVTEYMNPIIKMVGDLVENKHAYVANGEVLYSVRDFAGYGKLSHKKIDDLDSGARVAVDQKKKDPLDFSLWKPAKPGEPKWSAPWGEGRPGWHIECSAMIKEILGESIDIHGGGMDLIFPHHENEMAQSEGVTGKPFVRYWMHNNMLTFGDKKMSKSLGNIKTCQEFLTEYNGEILKFMMLGVHYRSLSDFSEKQIHNAISGLARIYSCLALIETVRAQAPAGDAKPSPAFAKLLEEQTAAFTASMNDDFGTPEAFAALYTLIRGFNSSYRHGQKVTSEIAAAATLLRQWILERGEMMSLFQEPAAAFLRLLDDMLLGQMGVERAQVDALVAERTQARTDKNYARGDELRKELTDLKIALQDTPTGTTWEVAK